MDFSRSKKTWICSLKLATEYQINMKKEQLDQLHAMLKEMETIFGRDEDIHRHTRRLGEICRQFIEFDNQYVRSLEKVKDINSVTQEILARCPANLKANVEIALNSITNSQEADIETGLLLHELLRRTWALKSSYANGEDLIFDNLNHNKTAGGGCIPGITARLIQPYTAFLYRSIETHSQAYNAEQSSLNKKAGYFEDDEQLGQALSASMYFSSPKIAGNHFEEDEDTLLAKALSLSLSNNSQKAGTRGQQPLLFSKSEDDELKLAIKLSAKEAQKTQEDADEEYAIKLHLSLNS
jgi:hypothetical protein